MSRFISLLLLGSLCFAGPWENPLLIARSSDGVTFEAPVLFQDSSGVPSLVRKNGDTLVCVFQWCRGTAGGPTWDKVAVKFSYDQGVNWTEPELIIINGLPPQYQRPFDPTLACVAGDSLRIYYSSSNGMPPPGGDSIIDTYSAIGSDGVRYMFESEPRVNHPTRRVNDPAVVQFRGLWQYLSPIGAPQDGAYHYISPDGLNFSRVQDILSDPVHNWTGNYIVNDTGDLRFYGCGSNIWFNSSPDGGTWLGYTGTGVFGGDPTVVKLDSNNYIMIFVGQPYAGINDHPSSRTRQPTALVTRGVLQLDPELSALSRLPVTLFDISGRKVLNLYQGDNDVCKLAPSVYFICSGSVNSLKVIIQK